MAASTSPPPESPPSRSTADPRPSAFSHFTYPVSYSVSSLLRRLSIDDAPTPLARALSANYNGSMTDPFNGVYHPPLPPRRLSPFQPPPLTPLTLTGYSEDTKRGQRLLEKALAEEIRLLVPPRLQLVDRWRLGYSLAQDGASLSRLYGIFEEWRGKRGGYVLVIRDGGGGVFGAYLSDPPQPFAHYYGTGETFLWRAIPLPALPDLSSLPPPPSADTTNLQRMTTIGQAKNSGSSSSSLASLDAPPGDHDGVRRKKETRSGRSTPERIRFKAFPYSGENDYTIFCQHAFLSLGGGDGRYGLWLDDTLASGVSDACPTFKNEPLSQQGTKFDVLGVEIWHIG
ncbi:oxidation resistance protein 1 [Elasticomyces elasticus]|nr:oxidation resistance protein 1 [Elasticomyces elasticus]